MEPQIEYIDLRDVELGGVFQCIDCGAHATHKEEIRHYKNCNPGDAAYWAKYYANADPMG